MKWLLALVSGGNPLVLLAIAAVLIGLGASGGVTITKWWASSRIAAAEKALADYQLAAANVITTELQSRAERKAIDDRHAADIAAATLKGQRDAQQAMQPQLDELADLHVAVAAYRLRDANTAPGDHPAAGTQNPAAPVPDTATCEDRLRGARRAFEDVVAAALEVARAGADAGQQVRQLSGTIGYIQDVCTRPP